MEGIDLFVKMKNILDDIIDAYEREDEEELETALGKFYIFCMKLQKQQH
ncbi:hypothetical protein [Halobacillus sp. KGW1]|nr:hypothetical protein [Halobacillus sp. KGW1]